ncbi:galactose oxidase [Xylaria intraflava]|nr:galactose oxidase [Xylaria intraflava]
MSLTIRWVLGLWSLGTTTMEAMADSSRSNIPSRSSSRSMRTQKMAAIPEPDFHTPVETTDGNLTVRTRNASKSQSGGGPPVSSRRKASESSMRQHSHSVSKSIHGPPPPQTIPTPVPTLPVRRSGESHDEALAGSSTVSKDSGSHRSLGRPASIAPKASFSTMHSQASSRRQTAPSPQPYSVFTSFPPLQDPSTAADVSIAPSSGMYWLRAPVSGHKPVQAYTTTLLGNSIFVFGGSDNRARFDELYVLDADAFHWSMPQVTGDIPTPLRAMTCTAVGKKLVLFGGGDGPAYYNSVYVLDTVTFRWHKPRIIGDQAPSVRGAHTACLYKNGIYIFGGGDGNRPLNDIWRLDVSDTNKMSWRLICGPDMGLSNGSSDGNDAAGVKKPTKPKARGYHTANMVGSKLIIYGGSTATERFNDVWVYDVDTHIWKNVQIPVPFRRVTHTSTLVGSYLFIIGGHDGREYSEEVLLFNLVTMSWDKRRVYGIPPSGRGYHGTVLHDSRLLVIGGFDGETIFDEVWILELAVHAYYSQISHFTIEV